MTGNADSDHIVPDYVAIQKRGDGLFDQLGRDGIGLTENLRVRDVIEGRRSHCLTIVTQPETNRLEARLSNVNSPRALNFCCH